jgi:polyhydroxyalkanoate synthesis regulator phasin
MGATRKKILLAVAAGVGSIGLFGAAALGTFGPDASSAVVSAVAPTAQAALGEDKGDDRLKHLLDGLVQKGVITQQQEDAILAAAKDARPKEARRVVRDFLSESAKYLDIPHKELLAKLPGTSLGAIADATPNKSKAGLVAALTKAANEDIAKALADKKITEDQATKLRDALPAQITKFVERTWPAKRPHALGSNVKGFLGDMLQTARDYLGGISVQELRTALRSGKSLGEIAIEKGKTPAGLVAALTTAANTRIDQAVAEKKLTAEQAASLKAKVATEVTAFVNRKMPAKATTTKP